MAARLNNTLEHKREGSINHLEQLVSEWYEYRGYFVRRNVRVEKRTAGGYDGELDVVALHPENKHLVHIETSMDALSWERREDRFKRKFAFGRRYVPALFSGMSIPSNIEQIVLLGYGGKGGRTTLAGARILLIAELLGEVFSELRRRSMHKEAVPEQYPLLRTLHFVAQHKEFLRQPLFENSRTNPTLNPDAQKLRAS